ncbi:MAG TPA: vitamin K epoxide reductase family protein [Propionibacteriaceae bacterium]
MPDADLDLTDEEAAGSGHPVGPGRGLPIVLIVGGALGLLAAMVLTIDRIRLLQNPDTQLACNISPFIACGPVMQSRAGELFGFPNPLLGIIGFTVVVTTGMVLLAGATLRRWYFRGLQVGALAAAVFITWLQTQSLYVIGALCLWCLLVWSVTIPVVVTVTLHNLAAGHLGGRLVALGRRLQPYAVTVVAVWYLIVIAAIALRFYREFALFWFGVAL